MLTSEFIQNDRVCVVSVGVGVTVASVHDYTCSPFSNTTYEYSASAWVCQERKDDDMKSLLKYKFAA